MSRVCGRRGCDSVVSSRDGGNWSACRKKLPSGECCDDRRLEPVAGDGRSDDERLVVGERGLAGQRVVNHGKRHVLAAGYAEFTRPGKVFRFILNCQVFKRYLKRS